MDVKGLLWFGCEFIFSIILIGSNTLTI